MEQLKERVNKKIKLSMKNATNYLSNELNKSSGKRYVNKEAVLGMIIDKVDK